MTTLLITLLWAVTILCALCAWLYIRWKRCERLLFRDQLHLSVCEDTKSKLELENKILTTSLSKARGRK